MTISDLLRSGKKFYKDNFFSCTSLLFVLWISFFDANSLVTQRKINKKIKVLKEEKQFYKEQIDDLKTKFESIHNNENQIKKFAKEKYFLREKGEEIYILKKK